MSDMQVKHLSLAASEIKFGAEGSLQFSGYASTFGGVDSYGDTIAKGAYIKTLEDRDRPVAMRWNHYGPIIGKYTSMKEDDIGLFVEGELTKGHSEAENVAALLRHGAISGLSIGYIAKQSEQEGPIRKLTEIKLIEISVVEEPADLGAQITTLKSCEKLKDVESVLRLKHGISQRDATAIVAAVKRIEKHSECVSKNEDNLKQLLNFKLGN